MLRVQNPPPPCRRAGFEAAKSCERIRPYCQLGVLTAIFLVRLMERTRREEAKSYALISF